MAALLEVDGLVAGYGEAQVLFQMGFDVGAGEVVTLMGRNGMGKTTTINCVMGLVKAGRGRVSFAGQDLTGAKSYKIAQAGLGLVPEGRQIFPTLSVEENLIATSANRRGTSPGWSLARVYEFFPRLKERRSNLGTQLSGGEQQMLAIGRALMTNPMLLILDEATEGLAPLIRAEIWACLEQLKGDGLSILVVDKNIDALEKFADRHVIVEKGEAVWSGDTKALKSDPSLRERFLSV